MSKQLLVCYTYKMSQEFRPTIQKITIQTTINSCYLSFYYFFK